MNFILIPHFGQKYIAKHSMQDVIDLHQVLGFSNNPTALNVQRGKLLLRHGLRMVVRANATIPLKASIVITKCIAESPPGHLKELITAHKRECASVIFSKVNSGIELMDKLNIKVAVN